MQIIIKVHVCIFIFVSQLSLAQEYNYYKNTNFEKHKMNNQNLLSQKNNQDRVVFMGNSITESWPLKHPAFATENKNYTWRGISGQTTSQMLLRFKKDVVAHEPKAVVILAGINDLAQNSGYTTIEQISENIKTMAELADYNGITVILCSVLPAFDFPWRRGLEPAQKVIELNKILKVYTKEKGFAYVDYHSAMKDEKNGLKVPEYTSKYDLVHPNKAGYIVMEKIIQPVIENVVSNKKK